VVLSLDRAPAPDVSTLGAFTRSELLAAASVIGVPALPTLGDGAPSTTELESARASLIARGFATTAGDGIEIDDRLADVIRTMVSSTTLVAIERGGATATSRSVVHLDARRAVSVAPCGAGVVRVDVADAASLTVVVDHELGLRQRATGPRSQTTVVTAEEIEAALSSETSETHAVVRALVRHDLMVRVRVLNDHDGVVTGGELAVAVGDDCDWVVTEVAGSSPAFACAPVTAADVVARVDDMVHGRVPS
jgi:hypothetical protein